MISPIVCQFFRINIITFSFLISSVLLLEGINGAIKVRHDVVNNNTSIEREMTGFNYDLPTIYILHSNEDHYIFAKNK